MLLAAAALLGVGSAAAGCPYLARASAKAPLMSVAHDVAARAGPDPLGPLAALVGTWEGVGQDVAQVPKYDSAANGNAAAGVTLLVHKYTETITFNAIGLVLNRGVSGADAGRGHPTGQADQITAGLAYRQAVADATTGGGLHEEGGQWLVDTTAGVNRIQRLGAVPHGVTIAAAGGAESVAPTADLEWLPLGSTMPLNAAGAPAAYTGGCAGNVACASPGAVLREATKGLNVTKVTKLSVDAGAFGVAQTPFIEGQATSSNFSTSLWIETVRGSDGKEFEQLQYMQTVLLAFVPRFDCPDTSSNGERSESCTRQPTMLFPHVQVCTLRRAAAPAPPSPTPAPAAPTPVPSPKCNVSAATNNNGWNLKVVQGSSLGACCDLCAATPQCLGYVFVAVADNACFLKGVLAPSSNKADDQAVFGTPATLAPVCEGGCDCEAGANNDGPNLKDAVHALTSAECCALCRSTDGCAGFVHVPIDNMGCYLKSALLPSSRQDPNAYVGRPTNSSRPIAPRTPHLRGLRMQK